MSFELPEVRNPGLMPFRFRLLPGGRAVVVTDLAGRFAILSREEFGDFVAGTLPDDHPAAARVRNAGLVRSAEGETDTVAALRRRSEHLMRGPGLHILILTLRCNQACVYCHASRKGEGAEGVDMSQQTAARVLDVVFASPSPDLTLEFQGGEPTLNFEVLRFVVEEASRRASASGKRVFFSLVSNLSPLDQEKIDFLVDHGVMVCSSIDGPAALHDRNRRWSSRSAHQATLARIEEFRRAYAKRGLDPELAFVNLLATVSRASLAQPEALVDEYVRLGSKVVHLRSLNPFGMGKKIWAKEGYTAEEYLAFYRRAFDHIVKLNRAGVEIMEKIAALALTRILTDDDPNYMDLRSPCGAGIGQLAYGYDGKVYTCDEGRMVAAMGDPMFCIGDVQAGGYADIIRHPGVRSLCVASCLECLPGCSDCAYAPYCGVCPVYNYVQEGDLVARWPQNDRCRIQMGIADLLFERLQEPGLEPLLRRWTINRDRSSVYRRMMPLTTPVTCP
ncbi:MAG TPA: His-Xaa-Ser system radical SAM maturase HxsB [Myxococcota bacterium]|nr:His-Xaa-Ser system radical SAM maturase HxsB [Myxococcota bacterium]HRY94079.1 His-Xaa-Ser system radical SAM maturase HxsB [Myxococcota bacterium]